MKNVVATRGYTKIADEANSAKRDLLVAIYKNQVWKLRDGETHFVRENLGIKMLPYSASCSMGDIIFLTGGELHDRSRGGCRKFSLSTLNSTVLPELNEARRHHAAVCVGDRVYVLGGEDGCDTPLRTVEYLDRKTRSWMHTTDMPDEQGRLTAVKFKHFIYVFDAYSTSKMTFVFDTRTQIWSRRRDMPLYCTEGSSVVYGDKIYVLGGTTKTCMSYNPDQDKWEIHSMCGMKHGKGSAVVWKDKILVCGGESNSVIEEYDPKTDTWVKWRHQLPRWVKEYAIFAVQL